jgi:(1->4)-alpha-D-glucan 1-alpha-D-glucosylmutase
LPGEWAALVGKWKLANARHVLSEGGLRSPSATFEYMIYQALVGAWPLKGPDDDFRRRFQDYVQKAAREGKLETSWLNPNPRYEEGLAHFVDAILDPERSAEFVRTMHEFAQRAALIGALNSLSQVTLKATMPGVPDFYQGTEFWDLSLVDPDNRRPVDFQARKRALAGSGDQDWTGLAARWPDGRIKAAWTQRLLALRAELGPVFSDGDYRPISVSGPHRDHVIAFARIRGGAAAVVAIARWFAPFTDAGRRWPRADAVDATLGLGDLVVELDGRQMREEAPASALFGPIPVAVWPASVRRARP